MNRIIVLFLFCGFLNSCSVYEAENKTNQVKFNITSPQSNWVFYSNEEIFFSTNLKDNNIEWFSSIDGKIGYGNNFSSLLTVGEHFITAKTNSSEEKISVCIKEREINIFDTLNYVITKSSQEIYIPSGHFEPMVQSYDYIIENFEFQIDEFLNIFEKNTFFKCNLLNNSCKSPQLIRDIAIPRIKNGLTVDFGSKKLKTVKSNEVIDNQVKTFFVVNTENQLSSLHEIIFECISVQEKYTLWKPQNVEIKPELLKKFIFQLNELIFPRVTVLWGESIDIDNDGKIAIVLTDTLNKENNAIGYFNPQDLFLKNDDILSENYNPYSNEKDVVFLAIPEEDVSSIFNLNSILATAAHEITHLINFSNKTYKKLLYKGDYKQEDIFLDEGWSHLSELLCGFGVSGGNIEFLNEWLKNTDIYSFSGTNIYGQDDSAGMRGAICLFLSYLFWEAGGYSWDADFKLIDNGGISFLRKMTSSNIYGWESIGDAFGKSTDKLFSEFMIKIAQEKFSTTLYSFNTDPVTHEPIEFFTNMGDFLVRNYIVNITHPKSVKIGQSISLPEHAFVFYENLYFSKLSKIRVLQKSEKVFLSYMKYK